MTREEFVYQCSVQCTGVIKYAASCAFNNDEEDIFIEELLEQDSEEGSRSGTKYALGPKLYAELQKFK